MYSNDKSILINSYIKRYNVIYECMNSKQYSDNHNR